MPDAFFVGVGSQVLSNLHNWADRGVKLVDGKATYFPIKRFFETTEDDLAAFKAEGVSVIRLQVNVDGALFWKECDYQSQKPYDVSNTCYDNAYRTASKGGWQQQTDALPTMADNPVIQMAAEYVAQYNAAGFHVIVTPSDFFWGGSANWNSGTTDPLLHVYLDKDKAFRTFFPRWAAALVAAFRQRGITNFSLQSINEPRWCSQGKPSAANLQTWKDLERAEFDAARRVAPRLSLVSSAICTSANQYLSDGRDYGDIKLLMPIHDGLDDVIYSLHYRDPRLISEAEKNSLKPGALVRYPYVPMPASMGLDSGTRYRIGVYNKEKPNAALLDQEFSDLEDFAKSKNVRLIVTEFDVAKPNFGISPEDRFAFVRDAFAAAKTHAIPMIYFSIVDAPGLSSCVHSQSIPDHRFDPNLMRLIGVANSVPGQAADAPLVPIEAICGKATQTQTLAVAGDSHPDNGFVQTLFDTRIAGLGDSFQLTLQGFAGKNNAPLGHVQLLFHETVTDQTAASARSKCGITAEKWDDGTQHLKIPLALKGTTYTIYDVACIASVYPKAFGPKVMFVLKHLPDMASDMAASGAIGSVSVSAMRDWLQAVADGDLTIAASSDAAPRYATTTREEFVNGGPDDSAFNSLFKTTTADVAEFGYNVQGRANGKAFFQLAFMLQAPLTADQAKKVTTACQADVGSWDDGTLHMSVDLAQDGSTFTLAKLDCLKAYLPKEQFAQINQLGTQFAQIARDMVDSGAVDAVVNHNLQAFIRAVADGDVVIAGSPS
ncbi:MAG TPA: cellulase family glycosylhydrolase [Bauldia sp.]|nr:cellulase family glycosylhydrolase [Bauldia sp.]